MQRSAIWGQLKQLVRFGYERSTRAPLCGIHSIDQFRALIEHERRRSDRTGDRFAIVVFRYNETATDLSRLCRFPDLLIQSVRSTDEVGWFDKNQVGVLLLDTTVEGADKFLQKLRVRFTNSSLPPFQTYVYPSHYLAGSDDTSGEIKPLDVELKLDSYKDSQPLTTIQAEEKAADMVSGLEPHLGISIPLWKRAFDILSASTGLIFLSPFLILVAVVIKAVSPGPVLFKQQRVGYLGKPFRFLKFRTMEVGTKSSIHDEYVRSLIRTDVPMKKLDRHRQIIPFGKFLRSSAIDELPQLINVLRGDMSLVGPRPCTPSEFQEYLHWHKRRFYTLPGITGLWQVKGKHKLTFKEMIRYDITYEQQRSFWLDFKTIIGTFPTVYHMSTDG